MPALAQSPSAAPGPPAWRRGIDAVLYSSTWLALAAAALTAATLRQWPFEGPGEYHLVALVLAATLLSYNLDAALPFKQGQPAGTSVRKAWQQRHRLGLLWLAAVSAAVAGYFFLTDGWWHFLPLLLPLSGLALLYSWPLLRWNGRRRALRELPLLKGVLIALVWTAVTVGLPTLLRHHPVQEVWELLAQQFCWILVITIVFDIRDYGRDRRAGTRTLPGALGVARAKGLALMLLAASAAMGLSRGAAPLAVLLPAAVATAVVLAAEESRSEYFYALLVDGLLLAQAVGVYWGG